MLKRCYTRHGECQAGHQTKLFFEKKSYYREFMWLLKQFGAIMYISRNRTSVVFKEHLVAISLTLFAYALKLNLQPNKTLTTKEQDVFHIPSLKSHRLFIFSLSF